MKKYYYKSLVTGFYGVCAEKGFREGFINKCRKASVPIRSVKGYGRDKLYFYVPCEFFDELCEIAVLSGMELKVTGSFGVLPFAKKYSYRCVLFFGILLGVIFLSLMSLRIWSISVSGNDKVFASEIIGVCEELGLKTGIRKSKIDIEEFQNALLSKMGDKLIWASLNIEGMCAELEVRELSKTEDDIIGKPCNYIADFDGTIKIYRVYSGTPAVGRGFYVRKGDLLISGVIDYETGESSFTEASGKITAEHEVSIKTKEKEKSDLKGYGREKTRYSISLFGLELKPPMPNAECFEITKEEKYLSVNGKQLPFYVGKYKCTEYIDGVCSEALNELATLSDYLCAVREGFKNSRVIGHTEKYNGGYSGKYDVIDYIGEKSVIMLENG